MSFLILRHMRSLNHSLELARKLFEFHDRYPNSIDEIWFCCGTFDGIEEIVKDKTSSDKTREMMLY